MKKQKALRNSPWDMAAFCFGCAVAGFSLLFAVLLFTGSMLLLHPAASLVFAALELAVFFFLLLSKRLGISRWIRRFLLVSLVLGILVVLCVFVVFVLLLLV